MDDLGETRRISSPKRPPPKRLSCEGGTGAEQVSACRKHGAVLRALRWTREKRGLNRIFFRAWSRPGRGRGGCVRKKRRARRGHRLNARGGGKASGFSGSKKLMLRSLTK